LAAFARVKFIAHAASFPHEIARKRVGGKKISARAFFPPPLELRGSARPRQTGDFFAAWGFYNVYWRFSKFNRVLRYPLKMGVTGFPCL
jgi:hypothetical protein